MSFQLAYKPYGKHAILVEWPKEINENILKDILHFKDNILKLDSKLILYVNNAYNSLLVKYDLSINNIYDEILDLKQLYNTRVSIKRSAFKLWKIPVCYDAEFGIDLDVISKKNNLIIPEIIKLHSQIIYTVYFIGFLPGFLYLGGLDKQLYFSRKMTPRLQVKKGAVAIGEKQTGIYPNQSPGGWNIIGNSPIKFFNSHSSIPCFAKAGDKIQFVPVSLEKYQAIVKEIDDNSYQIENELIYD